MSNQIERLLKRLQWCVCKDLTLKIFSGKRSIIAKPHFDDFLFAFTWNTRKSWKTNTNGQQHTNGKHILLHVTCIHTDTHTCTHA